MLKKQSALAVLLLTSVSAAHAGISTIFLEASSYALAADSATISISGVLVDYDACLYSKRNSGGNGPADDDIQDCIDEISNALPALCARHARGELRGEVIRNSVHDQVYSVMQSSLEDECNDRNTVQEEAPAGAGGVSCLSPEGKTHTALTDLNDAIMQAATTHARVEAWVKLAVQEKARRQKAMERTQAALDALPPDVSDQELAAACRPIPSSDGQYVTYSNRCHEMTARSRNLSEARRNHDRARGANNTFSVQSVRRGADQTSGPYTELLWLRRCLVGRVREESGAPTFACSRSETFFNHLSAAAQNLLTELGTKASKFDTRNRRLARPPSDDAVEAAFESLRSGATYDERDPGLRSGESAQCDAIMAPGWDGAWPQEE